MPKELLEEDEPNDLMDTDEDTPDGESPEEEVDYKSLYESEKSLREQEESRREKAEKYIENSKKEKSKKISSTDSEFLEKKFAHYSFYHENPTARGSEEDIESLVSKGYDRGDAYKLVSMQREEMKKTSRSNVVGRSSKRDDNSMISTEDHSKLSPTERSSYNKKSIEKYGEIRFSDE